MIPTHRDGNASSVHSSGLLTDVVAPASHDKPVSPGKASDTAPLYSSVGPERHIVIEYDTMYPSQRVLARWPSSARSKRSRHLRVQRCDEIESILTGGNPIADGSSSPSPVLRADNSDDGAAKVWWPAVVSRVYGCFHGALFEPSANGFGLLQLEEEWEDVQSRALSAPLQVLVDVIFCLDESTEAGGLSIRHHPEPALKPVSLQLSASTLPDVVALNNIRLEGRVATRSKRSVNDLETFSSCNSWLLDSKAVPLYDLLLDAAPSARLTLLDVSVQDRESIQQEALKELQAVWVKLRELRLSAAAIRLAKENQSRIQNVLPRSDVPPRKGAKQEEGLHGVGRSAVPQLQPPPTSLVSGAPRMKRSETTVATPSGVPPLGDDSAGLFRSYIDDNQSELLSLTPVPRRERFRSERDFSISRGSSCCSHMSSRSPEDTHRHLVSNQMKRKQYTPPIRQPHQPGLLLSST